MFGGSGHIGSAIVRQLASEGWQLTIVSRRSHLPPSLNGVDAAVVSMDDRQPEAIADLRHHYALIVDAGAPYPLSMLHDVGGLFAVASGRTRALLRLARHCDATLIYVGSYITERRHRSGLSWLQGNAFRRLHPYFAVKKRIAEELLAAREVEVTVVQPTVCFGPWDGKPVAQCIIPQLARGNVAALVKRTLNIVDVRDVALALVGAFRHRRCGQVISVCGHNISLMGLAQRVCALASVPAPRLQVPSSASAWLSLVAQLGCELAGVSPPLPALAMMLLCESGPRRISGAQHALGATPRPLDETLRDAFRWYRALGYC